MQPDPSTGAASPQLQMAKNLQFLFNMSSVNKRSPGACIQRLDALVRSSADPYPKDAASSAAVLLAVRRYVEDAAKMNNTLFVGGASGPAPPGSSLAPGQQVYMPLPAPLASYRAGSRATTGAGGTSSTSARAAAAGGSAGGSLPAGLSLGGPKVPTPAAAAGATAGGASARTSRRSRITSTLSAAAGADAGAGSAVSASAAAPGAGASSATGGFSRRARSRESLLHQPYSSFEVEAKVARATHSTITAVGDGAQSGLGRSGGMARGGTSRGRGRAQFELDSSAACRDPSPDASQLRRGETCGAASDGGDSSSQIEGVGDSHAVDATDAEGTGFSSFGSQHNKRLRALARAVQSGPPGMNAGAAALSAQLRGGDGRGAAAAAGTGSATPGPRSLTGTGSGPWISKGVISSTATHPGGPRLRALSAAAVLREAAHARHQDVQAVTGPGSRAVATAEMHHLSLLQSHKVSVDDALYAAEVELANDDKLAGEPVAQLTPKLRELLVQRISKLRADAALASRFLRDRTKAHGEQLLSDDGEEDDEDDADGNKEPEDEEAHHDESGSLPVTGGSLTGCQCETKCATVKCACKSAKRPCGRHCRCKKGVCSNVAVMPQAVGSAVSGLTAGGADSEALLAVALPVASAPAARAALSVPPSMAPSGRAAPGSAASVSGAQVAAGAASVAAAPAAAAVSIAAPCPPAKRRRLASESTRTI